MTFWDGKRPGFGMEMRRAWIVLAAVAPLFACSGSGSRPAGQGPAFSLEEEVLAIAGTPAATIYEGSFYQFTPTVTGATNNVTFAILSKPAWAAFDPVTGSLSGTPAYEHVGSYPGIVISVFDDNSTAATLPFAIEVIAVNNVPTRFLYVAPNIPAGLCNIGADYTSIAEALADAVPGDAVRLLPGTYRTAVDFPHGGTLDKPITLTYTSSSGDCPTGGPRTAVIDCSPANVGNANCIQADHSNITIDGLVFAGAAYNGIKVDGDRYGSVSEGSYGNYGMYYARNRYVNGADNVIIRNNYVHTIGFDGIKVGHVNNILIESNEVYDTGVNGQQQGIDLVGVYDAVVRGNYIHDGAAGNMNAGLFAKGGSENTLFENNIIENVASPYACLEVGGDTEWHNTRYTPSRFGFDINSLILQASQTDAGNVIDGPDTYAAELMAEARNTIVRGNALINCDPPLSFRNAYNAKVYHNTIINSGGSQGWVKLWSDGNNYHPDERIHMHNNLFFNDTVALRNNAVIQDKSQGTGFPSNLTDFVFVSNLISNMGATPSLDVPLSAADPANQISGNPELDNAFKPLPGSIAIDAGSDLMDLGVVTEPFYDRDGTVRPSGAGFDIGAYEAD